MGVLDRFRRSSAYNVRSADHAYRSLVAAGQRIDITQKKAVESLIRRREAWQEEAWSYYHAVGELKYAARFQGNLLSRAKFFPAIISPNADVPVPIEQADGLPPGFAAAALDEMERLGDFNSLIKRLVVCWQVPGEGWLLGRTVDGEETWEVASRSQLISPRDTGKVSIRYSVNDKTGEPIDLENDVLIRLWQEDEQWPGMADSPMRSLLYEIEELLILSRHIRSIGRSRLANGNILTLPSEISSGPGLQLASPDGLSGAQPATFVEKFQDAMIEPIHDEGSAAAISPVILEAAYQFLDRVKFIEQPRTIDPIVDARIEKLFLRFARSWNLPPERMLGMAGTTFANASQIERSEWDAHLAPLAEALGLSIAKGWLRSSLMERGYSAKDVHVLTICADPARAVTNPTLATDAKDAHKALTIKDETLRRALGFDEGDAPDEEEYARRAALLRGSFDPTLTTELLNTLLKEVLGHDPVMPSQTPPSSSPADAQGPTQTEEDKNAKRDLPPAPATPDGGQDTVPRESPQSARVIASASPTSELGHHLVAVDQALTQRILDMVDAVVVRGIEKAGSRLRAAVQSNSAVAKQVRGLPADQVGITLGRDLVMSLGVDEDALVAEVLAGQRERYLQRVELAQIEAISETAQLYEWSADRRIAVLGRLAETRERSWTILSTALIGLTGQRLFERVPAIGIGERDDTLVVPAAMVRGALAIAGGNPEFVLGSVLPPPIRGEFTGGAAVGATLLGEMKNLGAAPTHWVWAYGAVPRTPFPPHRVLDGLPVASAEDSTLTNQLGFPHFGSFYPGDHAGCLCGVAPVFA